MQTTWRKIVDHPFVQLSLLVQLTVLMLCNAAYAMGMGSINVTSGLGQPLRAKIYLEGVSEAAQSSLIARLAAPQVYTSAGLKFPFGNKFNFQIEGREFGQPYLSVSSTQPINEPVVNMLVELIWASGTLIGEYTLVLHPVAAVAEQPVPSSDHVQRVVTLWRHRI